MKTLIALTGWKILAAALMMALLTGCATRYSAGLAGYNKNFSDPCALWIKARAKSSFKYFTGREIPEILVEERVRLEPWMYTPVKGTAATPRGTEYFSLQTEASPQLEEWMLTPGKVFCCLPDNLLIAKTPIKRRISLPGADQ